MVRRDNPNTYKAAQMAHSKVLAAQREMEAEETPMRRYVYPVPQPAPGPRPAGGADLPAAMTQVLEQLACQNQLLVDLLGAVNSLTAALLCRGR